MGLVAPQHMESLFLSLGWNPCPLLWQENSYPLDHQGSSRHWFLWDDGEAGFSPNQQAIFLSFFKYIIPLFTGFYYFLWEVCHISYPFISCMYPMGFFFLFIKCSQLFHFDVPYEVFYFILLFTYQPRPCKLWQVVSSMCLCPYLVMSLTVISLSV